MRRKGLDRFKARCPMLRVPPVGIISAWAELETPLRAVYGAELGNAVRHLQDEQRCTLWAVADPAHRHVLAAVVTHYIPQDHAWAECELFVFDLWPDQLTAALKMEAERGDCASIEITVSRDTADRVPGYCPETGAPGWYVAGDKPMVCTHRGHDVRQMRQPFKASPRPAPPALAN